MGAHYFIFIWYSFMLICLLLGAAFKGNSVPDSLGFLAAFIPLAGVPLSIILALIGSITSLKIKRYKFTATHIGFIIAMFGLLKYIGS